MVYKDSDRYKKVIDDTKDSQVRRGHQGILILEAEEPTHHNDVVVDPPEFLTCQVRGVWRWWTVNIGVINEYAQVGIMVL